MDLGTYIYIYLHFFTPLTEKLFMCIILIMIIHTCMLLLVIFVFIYIMVISKYMYIKRNVANNVAIIYIYLVYLLHYDKPFAIIRIFTVHVCQWNSIMSINLIDDCIALPPAVRFDQPNIFPFTIISL